MIRDEAGEGTKPLNYSRFFEVSALNAKETWGFSAPPLREHRGAPLLEAGNEAHGGCLTAVPKLLVPQFPPSVVPVAMKGKGPFPRGCTPHVSKFQRHLFKLQNKNGLQ